MKNAIKSLIGCRFLYIMVFVALSVVASAQTVSLNIKNKPLGEALQAITKATNYEFVYSDVLDVKALTTIECNNEDLKSVLDKIFGGKGIVYKIDGKIIALSPSGVAPKMQNPDKKHVLKGVITDDAGITMPGVAVYNRTTGAVAAADIDGAYSIEAVPGDQILFTSIGMTDYTVVVGNSDMQEYIDAKRNLIAHQTSADCAVLNLDNATSASFAADCDAPVSYFSRREPVAHGCWLNEDGYLVMSEEGTDNPIMHTSNIRIPGVHNIENYMAAIYAVWGKVAPEDIRRFANAFGGVAHRCELVRERNGVRWYNDSIGSSPSRTIAGLKAFTQKVVLIAGGYDKHIPYDPLGPVAADTVKCAILMGATAGAIETAIRAHSDLPIYRVGGMEEAVQVADRITAEGDIVFMSPASASFDMYKNFEVRGNHFRDLVNALVE